MNVEEHVIKRDGCALHYWLTERRASPLVVLTHGATLDHHMFDTQLPALANEYRVLTWDMRGHSVSQPMGYPFSVTKAVEDLLAILGQVGIEQATFIGQSTGGYVIQELVFRYPERATALVIIDCTCITLSVSLLEKITLQLTTPMFRLYPFSLLKKQIATSSSIKRDVQRYIYEAGSHISKADFVTIWGAVANCLHDEPGYRIAHPLLLVQGEPDRLGNIAKVAPVWAARDPNCHFHVIPDAGHCSNQDNPKFFTGLLLEFLQQHIPTVS